MHDHIWECLQNICSVGPVFFHLPEINCLHHFTQDATKMSGCPNKNRENNDLEGDEAEGWSEFMRVMSPTAADGNQQRHHKKPGYIVKRNLQMLPDKCGIYEWKIRLPKSSNDGLVVYVGSSCTSQGGLRGRVREYCKDGSHIKPQIDDALNKGYELHVHYKLAENTETARRLESNLLRKYNYAWNSKQNGTRCPDGY